MEQLVTLMGHDPRKDRMDEIKAERKAITAAKRKLTEQLKNEKRKRQRLIQKSSRLSNMELLDVMRIRQEKLASKADGPA